MAFKSGALGPICLCYTVHQGTQKKRRRWGGGESSMWDEELEFDSQYIKDEDRGWNKGVKGDEEEKEAAAESKIQLTTSETLVETNASYRKIY